METLIKEKLKEIERKYNVRILYAVESGSRAWGFSSANSDYDVRFIYVNAPTWYVTVHEGRDVIEEMDRDLNLDFAGWDLKKALGLLYKGNPPLLEWLDSPIVYYFDMEFTEELRNLSYQFTDVKSGIYHYLHMAQGNYNAYIKDRNPVLTKKYLYITRPLLACEWLLKHQTIPPMQMEHTLYDFRTFANNEIGEEIHNLIEAKKSGKELGVQKPNPIINDWIVNRLAFFSEHVKQLHGRQRDVTSLNTFLYKWVHNGPK